MTFTSTCTCKCGWKVVKSSLSCSCSYTQCCYSIQNYMIFMKQLNNDTPFYRAARTFNIIDCGNGAFKVTQRSKRTSFLLQAFQVIVVTRVGVMYLICIKPKGAVNTNQLHHSYMCYYYFVFILSGRLSVCMYRTISRCAAFDFLVRR